MFNHKKIESKWQKKWEDSKIFEVKEDPQKKKMYILDMFPYPSAEGLHVGHPEGYTASDIITRKRIMEGYNVLHPMGWDAFGLPAENYAIKHKIHPAKSTAKNIKKMKKQIKSLGFAYDWSREINTTDPEYYKWTQWIFLQMFKRGLAYESVVPINWCPSCKTGLANEEVVEGKCERCGAEVQKKDMKQWLLRITEYAERLLEGLEKLDWPEKIKEMQRNWIGKSEGVEINFKGAKCDIECPQKSVYGMVCEEYDIPVFTTRIDTIFGVTSVTLAPEHPLVLVLVSPDYREKVDQYIEKVKKKSEIERLSEDKEKTGVPLGASVINPITGEKVPIWIADYVLPHYGTGAVMNVPAHDQRDFDFAKKYGLDIKWVIAPPHELAHKEIAKKDKAYEEDGYLVNSGEFNGLTSRDARVKLADYIESKNFGRRQTNYHLRDWVFSRQRYWGEPIPLVFCENCAAKIKNKKLKIKNNEFNEGELRNPGWIAVPENELPLKLPDVKHYEPTGTGESPLATISEWVNVKCPKCGGKARRETNTMPQWAGSCWYFLAYLMRGDRKSKISSTLSLPLFKGESKGGGQNPKLVWDKGKINYWMPVDLYVGGAEHAVLHLLYARFWYKFLYDLKLVPNDEPFLKLKNQGIILGEDGMKMSKSRGNVINPDDIIERYGADTMRLYEMFMGPFEETKQWDTKSIVGIRRFLERVWLMFDKLKTENRKPKADDLNLKSEILNLTKLMHKTIKGVSEDIESFKFNTAISKLMIYSNALVDLDEIPITNYQLLIILLSPFAPHLCEEIWEKLGHKNFIVKEKWPEYDPELVKDEEIELVVQVNGKLRDTLRVPVDISEEEAKKSALESEKIQRWIEGKEIKKIVFVDRKLINIVV